MKRMFKVVACVLGFWTVSAVAVETSTPATGKSGALVCERYGFTNKAEEFHSIKATKQQAVFTITSEYVMYKGVKYETVNPEWVGLDGIAITYHTDKNNKLLYLYVTDAGEREVGISSIEPDSDTIFRDKAVYKDCHFKEEVQHDTSNKVLRTHARGAQTALPVYVL